MALPWLSPAPHSAQCAAYTLTLLLLGWELSSPLSATLREIPPETRRGVEWEREAETRQESWLQGGALGCLGANEISCPVEDLGTVGL